MICQPKSLCTGWLISPIPSEKAASAKGRTTPKGIGKVTTLTADSIAAGSVADYFALNGPVGLFRCAAFLLCPTRAIRRRGTPR